MAKNETLVTLELDYVAGHLRHGHKELYLDDKELEEFKTLSTEEQIERVCDEGHMVIDDWDVNDYEAGCNDPVIH